MQAPIRYAGKTDRGQRRESNQDHYIAADLSRALRVGSTSLDVESNSRLFGAPLGYLFMVADGMGGHQGGNRASELAINYYTSSILNSLRWMIRPGAGSEERFLSDLKEILSAAHRAILADSDTDSGFKGMGTTLTMAYVVFPKMWIVHAGDTRCYVLRGNELRQITRDHTMADQLVASGTMPAEASNRSPWANVLWNALGAGAKDVVAEIYQVDLIAGDRVLLCSDGVNKHLDDPRIANLLIDNPDPDMAVTAIIDSANQEGGSDNITAIVAQVFESRPHDLITTVAVPPREEPIIYQASDFSIVEPEPKSDTDPSTDEIKPFDTVDFVDDDSNQNV